MAEAHGHSIEDVLRKVGRMLDARQDLTRTTHVTVLVEREDDDVYSAVATVVRLEEA